MSSIGAVRQAIEDFESKERKEFGTIRFVNSVTGNDMNNGLSRDRPFATIAAAVAKSAAGDTVLCRGSFSESVTVSLAGLKIIGAGNHPQETMWTSATDVNSLIISAENVLVENIKFRPPAYTAERDCCAIHLTVSVANYLTVKNCRFQGKAGSQTAIFAHPNGNVVIKDCEFIYMNTATYGCGIRGTATTGLAFSAWSQGHRP
jgi:hypothetical protein